MLAGVKARQWLGAYGNMEGIPLGEPLVEIIRTFQLASKTYKRVQGKVDEITPGLKLNSI
jgi:hypothetical protein